MRNSPQGGQAALDKVPDSEFRPFAKKLSKFFTEKLMGQVGRSIIWTNHSAKRLWQRFGGKINESVTRGVIRGIRLLQDEAGRQYKKVAVDLEGVRVVVARNENSYAVVTVISDERFYGGYSFRND
jgi:hypothetical protein